MQNQLNNTFLLGDGQLEIIVHSKNAISIIFTDVTQNTMEIDAINQTGLVQLRDQLSAMINDITKLNF